MEIGMLLADLEAESADLDRIVSALEPGQWTTPTPAEGWNVAHQVAHLAWTDDAAILAATDAEGFGALVEEAMVDPERFVDRAAEAAAEVEPDELVHSWREGRRSLARAHRVHRPKRPRGRACGRR